MMEKSLIFSFTFGVTTVVSLHMNGQEALQVLERQMESAPDGVGIISFRGGKSIEEGLRRMAGALETEDVRARGMELHIKQGAFATKGAIIAAVLDSLVKVGVEGRDAGTRIIYEKPPQSPEAEHISAVYDLVETGSDLLLRSHKP